MCAVRVVLRRANGRYVKHQEATSRYQARKLRREWEAIYDETYQVAIEKGQ